MAACGWSLDRLSPVLSPTSVAGYVRRHIAHELGLPAGLPVVIGVNDGASATLATGAIQTGDTTITLSTNGVLRVILDAALPSQVRVDHALFNWPYLAPLWIAGGQIKAGASSLNWFAQIVDRPLEVLITEAAASPPGCRGVLFLPYLIGRGSPHSDPSATGTFAGLTFATQRGDLVRAVLEGTAFALRDISVDLFQLGYPPRQIRICGGGARSALWRQIVADILAEPLSYYESDSTLGATVVAAVGLGLHQDFQKAVQSMVYPLEYMLPLTGHAERYNGLYAAFRQLRDNCSPDQRPEQQLN